MLDQEELKYKEYLKLQKRKDELSKKINKLPNVKLDKPYQSGWIISYDVREDIKRRSNYPIIKEVIELGWHDSYTKNVNVIRAIRRKEKTMIKSRFGSLNCVSTYYPQRKNISDDTYQKLDFKTNRYFELDTSSERYRKYQRKEYYVTVPSFWLVLKVKPNMITHKRKKGGEMESEYDCIMHRLYWSGEFQSFIINYGRSYPVSKDRARTRSDIRKFLNGDIEDIYVNKVPLEYEY